MDHNIYPKCIFSGPVTLTGSGLISWVPIQTGLDSVYLSSWTQTIEMHRVKGHQPDQRFMTLISTSNEACDKKNQPDPPES